MSHIQVILMQGVNSHGFEQLWPCGSARYSPHSSFHRLVLSACGFLHGTSYRWIHHSGVWRMVALFSQLH